MKKLVGKNRKRCLSALVALALTVGGVAEAWDHSVVSYNDHVVFDILYYDKADKGNWTEKFWENANNKLLVYDFSADIKNWVNNAGRQWAEILYPGISSMKQPAQLIVGNGNNNNAFTKYYNYDKGYVTVINNFKNIFQAGKEQAYIDFSNEKAFNELSNIGFGPICIGQYCGADKNDGNYGWSGDVVGQVSQQEKTVNLTKMMFHEIAHALGIYAFIIRDEKGHDIFYFDSNDSNTIENHLIDQKGNKAKDRQIIVSNLNALDEDTKKDFKEHPENYFIITHNKAYFTGNNVTKVLEGRTFEKKDGVPILAAEGGIVDLSHIELERSMMSHQTYSSYNTFMEAELAVMQDLGYKIDRQNFYGKSIYKNGEKAVKNSQGFFARNDAGTDYIIKKPNTSTMGVGLHIYGSYNTVTQARGDNKEAGSADLLACGAGAAGIRIDGVENTVTLANDANIKADGLNGVGILVAYGRDHHVNVEGNVSARGDGGDAIRFDFGSSWGGTYEYRGSFIRYMKYGGNGKITGCQNLGLKDTSGTDRSFSDHTEGDLGSKMGSLKISSTVAGKDHAIYIAKNAFVDRIDIENGAKISGDIVSEWKHFGNGLYDGGWGDPKYDEKLKIQYDNKTHYYDEYCKDLVTDLNVNGDFNYSGNITGTDNMKLKINQDATMVYTGKADVVSVQVAEEAALYGGSYKVNEITKYASFEPKDDEAGTFINHGTIGPLDENSHMEIEGNLKSDGTLLGQAGGEKGAILVTGKATLDTGSKVSAVRGIHGERIRILETGGGITGTENVSGLSRGLLNYSAALSKDGKSLAAIAKAKESLAGAGAQQAKDYENINNKASHYVGVAGVDNELRCFYALDTDAKALQAIDEIGTNDKGDSTVAIVSAQSSGLNGRVLSSRLATVMGQTPAMRRRGTSSPADDSTDKAGAPVNRPQEPGHSIWARFDRNWGDTAGSSNYTGSTYTMGGDWRHRENQRNGWFVSYTMRSYGHSDGSENLQDTRLGYYTGITKGADTLLLYADFGYLDGSRSRSVSIPTLGTCNVVKGDYTGWLVELGGEWKRALHEPGTTTWQVSPYGALQMSYMKQNGYEETGSMKAYDVSGGDNFYSALEGGVEFGRDMPNGSLNFRLGLNQALCGTNYEAHETGFSGRSYTKSSRVDKTHFITSLAVETELAPNRQLSAELAYQKGAHDKDFMVNVQLKWLW